MNNTPFNRRQFLAQTAVAGSLFAMAGSNGAPAAERSRAPTLAPKDSGRAATPLRILVLGGTGFIGSHFVRVALARGHRVAVFSRDKRAAELPLEVERLVGDRNSDLESIKNRDWDAVLDTPVLGPVWVRTLGEALKERVKHYTYISSVAVYENRSVDADENSALMEYKDATDPYSLTLPRWELGFTRGQREYGELKVLCEREAERQFPGKTLIVRPTVIVGPNDGGGAFTYLCARMNAGGEMLATGDPLSRMQIIDVRDMVEWAIRMIEIGETGPFNLAGPALPMSWAEMLGGLRAALAASVKLTWVPLDLVQAHEQKMPPFNPFLFWPTEVSVPGLMRMSNDKACAKGLTFRPLAVTAADTLAWFNSLPADLQNKRLLGSGLTELMQREREMLATWHARQNKG